jgi:hypothetical protein
LNVHHVEDWYSVTANTLIINGGSGLLKRYNNSISDLLSNVYTRTNWQPWRFANTQRGWFQCQNNQRIFFDWVADELNMQSYRRLYDEVTASQINRMGGGTILQYHNNSIKDAIYNLFQFEILEEEKGKENSQKSPILFDRSMDSILQGVKDDRWETRGDLLDRFFGTLGNRRIFLDMTAELSNISKTEDWYGIFPKDLQHPEGNILLTYYSGGLKEALKECYPDTTWEIWRFKMNSNEFWDDSGNCKSYLKWLEDQLDIRSERDWYGTTVIQIYALHGYSFLNYHGEIYI